MEYNIGDVIGRGGCSTVRLARPKNQGPKIPQVIAVKSSKLSQAAMILQEESILKKFKDCPHILQCFGSNYNTEEGEEVCNLLLEYAAGGSLADKMKKQPNGRFLEPEIRRYTKSILEGIVYIHKKGYVHRDIKPENILVCSEESLKIADFGLARRAGESRGEEGDPSKLKGTFLYLSPEALYKNEHEAPADVWALGCLVAEIFSGVPLWQPLPGEDCVAVLMRIGLCEQVPQILGDISSQGKDFLAKIFVKDPKKRWTAKMLLDHPFIVDQSREQATPLTKSSCSVTKTPSSCKSKKGKVLSITKRFKRLVTCQGPDWSVSKCLITAR